MEQVACSHGAIFRKFELSALFVVAGVSLMACNSDVAAVVLPARFLANSLQCDASNLFLFGSSSDEYQKGDPIPPSQEAVVLRVRRGDPEPRQFLVGPGLLVDSSWPRGGSTVFAVLTWRSREEGENGELVRSHDLAASWTKVDGAPQGLIGVAFLSESVGYVWSSSMVYRTEDSGISWIGVKSPGSIIRGTTKPSLDRTGALWVPINHGPAWAKENFLARFSSAPEVDKILSNSLFRIDAIDASQLGSVWLAGQHQDRPAPELSRIIIGEQESRITHVANLDPGMPEYLRVSGKNVVVAIADMRGVAPIDRMIRSRDRGVSWEGLELPERRISSYCMADDASMWMVGSSGHVYPAE